MRNPVLFFALLIFCFANAQIKLDDSHDREATVNDEIEYIERDFYHRESTLGEKAAGKVPKSDTATMVANEMLNTKTTRKFFAIQGYKGSGKTVILMKIMKQVLPSAAELKIPIFIDVNKIIATAGNNLQLDDLISTTVGHETTDSILRVKNKVPENLILLIDDIDLLSEASRTQLLEHLKDLNEKGAAIAVTSAQDLGWPPEQTVVEIPYLNSVEIQQFLTQLWDKELGLKSTERHSEYAQAVAKVLEGDTIPKDFKTIKNLQTLLIDGNKNVFSGEKKFVSVRDYVASEASTPREVFRMLSEVKINKLKLMEVLTGKLRDFSVEYSVQALINTLSSEPVNSAITAELQKLRNSYPTKINQDLLILTKVDSSGKAVFIHAEHERYLAALGIVNELNTASLQLPETTKTILENPKYARILEYINGAMLEHKSNLFESIFKSITENIELLHAVLDNTIAHGFDNVASGIFEMLSDSAIIQDYLETKSEAPLNLKSKFNYKFGMLTDDSNNIGEFNKQEMLFRNNMDKTIKTLENVKIKSSSTLTSESVFRTNEFPRYLKEIVLAQSQPNMETFEIVKKNIPTDKLTIEFANELIYTLVDHECTDSRVYSSLEELGAVPSKIKLGEESLVDVAVKNLNPKLLKFVINDLKVAVAPESKLLFTALDMNPLNRYSASGFWQMMEVLVDHDIQVPKKDVTKRPQKGGNAKNIFVASAADKALPEYELFTGKADPASQLVRDLRLYSASLDKVSADLKTNRRKTVLRKYNGRFKLNKGTLTDILLKYRGLDELSALERAAYDRCIIKALTNDLKTDLLTEYQKNRIMRSLLDNIGSESDLTLIEQMKKNIEIQSQLHEMMADLNRRIQERYSLSTDDSSPPKSSELTLLDTEVMRTRAQLYPKLNRVGNTIPINPEFQEIFKITVDQKLQINNEKLEQLQSQLETKDPAKYQQLLDMEAKWVANGAERRVYDPCGFF